MKSFMKKFFKCVFNICNFILMFVKLVLFIYLVFLYSYYFSTFMHGYLTTLPYENLWLPNICILMCMLTVFNLLCLYILERLYISIKSHGVPISSIFFNKYTVKVFPVVVVIICLATIYYPILMSPTVVTIYNELMQFSNINFVLKIYEFIKKIFGR